MYSTPIIVGGALRLSSALLLLHDQAGSRQLARAFPFQLTEPSGRLRIYWDGGSLPLPSPQAIRTIPDPRAHSTSTPRLPTPKSMEAAAAKPVLRVAAICGSLRKTSFNRGLLRAAAEVCEDSIPGLRVDQLDISDLPIINTDLETDGGFPPAVEAFRAKVCQADCFLFGAPEYNYSIASYALLNCSSEVQVFMCIAAKLGSHLVVMVHNGWDRFHPQFTCCTVIGMGWFI
nr:uncharacterized protein LOC117857744 isoform X2 [Setaria viridis]